MHFIRANLLVATIPRALPGRQVDQWPGVRLLEELSRDHHQTGPCSILEVVAYPASFFTADRRYLIAHGADMQHTCGPNAAVLACP